MKNTLVRAAVLLLAVIGFGASYSASASSPKTTNQAQTDPSAPAPVCNFNDPKGCGIL